MKVDLGGGMEVVIEAHPGHTTSDLILRIPSQDTVFTGDLLFNHNFPVTFDADMAAWLKALDLLGSYGPNTLFVPGHGPVCGVEAVEVMKSVFGDLAEHARQMAQLGVPLREAQARYSPSDLFKDLSIFAWGFCVDQAVAQFYAAARAGKV
jgi:cyclase